jgi:sugar-specific transcriptional regulator TrmB
MDVFSDVLRQAGLDEIESKAYYSLLTNGALTILDLSVKAGLKRTNLYNVLESLEKKGLVKKVVKNKSIKYFPSSPREVQNLLDIKEFQINTAKNTFDILLSNLQSQYSLVSHKPAISYLEGLAGLQKLYDDINDTGKDICLLRSTYDDKRADVDKLVKKQLTAQVKRGIHARVAGPIEDDAKEVYLTYDKIRLVEERFISNFPINLPAQIIIYGNKTAIATIRKDIIITTIDNADITNTFRVLFDFIWTYATPEHEELVKSWK